MDGFCVFFCYGYLFFTKLNHKHFHHHSYPRLQKTYFDFSFNDTYYDLDLLNELSSLFLISQRRDLDDETINKKNNKINKLLAITNFNTKRNATETTTTNNFEQRNTLFLFSSAVLLGVEIKTIETNDKKKKLRISKSTKRCFEPVCFLVLSV